MSASTQRPAAPAWSGNRRPSSKKNRAEAGDDPWNPRPGREDRNGDPQRPIGEIRPCAGSHHRHRRLPPVRRKIVDVERRTIEGFARGEVTIDGIGDRTGSRLLIQFQNENLIAIANGSVIATVPDLITVIEADTGRPITTEELRYGHRVAVVGVPSDPQWRTHKGLELVGPRYFGYDIDYQPVESLSKEQS